MNSPATTECFLNAMGLCCSIGNDKKRVADALFSEAGRDQDLKRFLKRNTKFLEGGEGCYLGQVGEELPEIPVGYEAYKSRNNRILFSAFLQVEKEVREAISEYGSDRVAIILGTSTSGIAEGEEALFERRDKGTFPEIFSFSVQEITDGAEFLADFLDLSNTAVTISTACTSSNKTFAQAVEMIDAGLCDAAIVGGVDSLCKMTVNGFHALSALSLEPCNPFSKNRDGISIGEGGALFLITTKPMEVCIASVGESSDGYSMTSPDPEGRGAEKAMRRALELAGIQIEDVNYINLHGTGTLQNDSMEAKAVSNVFGANVLCSSTKSIVGHTLGAAGAVEAAFCWLMLSKKFNPKQKALPHIWDGIPDDNLHLKNFVKMGDLLPALEGDLYVLSNSFAFGGSNASLLLKREGRYD